MPKFIPLNTFMDHAPVPGGCKCGWRGDDLMAHVEPLFLAEARAKGIKLRDKDSADD